MLSLRHYFIGKLRDLVQILGFKSFLRSGSTSSTQQKQVQVSFSMRLPFSSSTGECHYAERIKCTASEVGCMRQSMPLLLKISHSPKSKEHYVLAGRESIQGSSLPDKWPSHFWIWSLHRTTEKIFSMTILHCLIKFHCIILYLAGQHIVLNIHCNSSTRQL